MEKEYLLRRLEKLEKSAKYRGLVSATLGLFVSCLSNYVNSLTACGGSIVSCTKEADGNWLFVWGVSSLFSLIWCLASLIIGFIYRQTPEKTYTEIKEDFDKAFEIVES